MGDPVWFLWPRDVVRVSGPDALSYLQGQLSQDVDALSVGSTTWSMALHPQGKVAAWFRLTRVAADAWVADIDGGHGPALIERLGRFKLRTKCDIEPLREWSVVAFRGPVDTPPPAEGCLTLPFSWNGWTGYDVAGPSGLIELPATPPQSADEFHSERIVARFPAMGAEIDDGTIPAEVGIVEASVSFTKGCYVGQELVARIDSRGATTPRVLRLVRSTAGGLAAGDELSVEGVAVGRLTSVAGTVALALVKRAVELPATALTPLGTPCLVS